MRLGYVILYTPNVRASLDFYARAFGLKARFVHESGTYAEMETGETILAFLDEEPAQISTPNFAPNRRDLRPAGAEIGLVVADVAAAFAIAVGAGAAPILKPTLKPWGQTVAYVRDGDGFLVELCTPMS